jgi:hypothetical protein
MTEDLLWLEDDDPHTDLPEYQEKRAHSREICSISSATQTTNEFSGANPRTSYSACCHYQLSLFIENPLYSWSNTRHLENSQAQRRWPALVFKEST